MTPYDTAGGTEVSGCAPETAWIGAQTIWEHSQAVEDNGLEIREGVERLRKPLYQMSRGFESHCSRHPREGREWIISVLPKDGSERREVPTGAGTTGGGAICSGGCLLGSYIALAAWVQVLGAAP